MSYTREKSQELRSAIFIRDKGICAECGRDCEAYEYWRKHNKAIWQALINQHAIPKHLHKDGTLWHADHLKPVHRNGGKLGLDNIQTLCFTCHADKTKLEAKGRKLTGTNPHEATLRRGRVQEIPEKPARNRSGATKRPQVVSLDTPTNKTPQKA